MLFLSLKGATQQLPLGKFVFSTGFTSTMFNFKKNARFDYKYSSCTGAQEGSGTYTYLNGQLILTFQDPAKELMPAIAEIKRTASQNDSAHLSFSFYDSKDKAAIAGATVQYKDRVSKKIVGSYSDTQGKLELVIQREQFPVEITVNYIAWEPEIISFDSAGNYSVSYPMNFEFVKQLMKGKELKFTINSINKKILRLKPIDAEEFRTFIRK